MVTFLLIFLSVIVILSVSLRRSYNHVPLKELKRRARKGDELAKVLHRAAAYGSSLQSILSLLVIASTSALFVLLALAYDPWLSGLLVASLLWLAFLWLPRRDIDRISLFIAKTLTPAIVWLLRYTHPVMSRLNTALSRFRPVTIHTGLWETEDLLSLLETQSKQSDNRIQTAELLIAQHVLTFGDKLIGDFLVPRSVVKLVHIKEPIGPLLMTELHESGFSRFPVYDESEDDIVGMLMLRDLINAKHGGIVRNYYSKDLHYIHEDQDLYSALAAMLNTQHHLFIVVNSFEEYVGVIGLEDVLEQLIGLQIIDEFDSHDNLREVAARMSKLEHKKLVHPTSDNLDLAITEHHHAASEEDAI